MNYNGIDQNACRVLMVEKILESMKGYPYDDNLFSPDIMLLFPLRHGSHFPDFYYFKVLRFKCYFVFVNKKLKLLSLRKPLWHRFVFVRLNLGVEFNLRV